MKKSTTDTIVEEMLPEDLSPHVNISEFLAAQLESAQRSLASQHEYALRGVAKSLQGQREVGADVRALQAENQILRTKLSAFIDDLAPRSRWVSSDADQAAGSGQVSFSSNTVTEMRVDCLSDEDKPRPPSVPLNFMPAAVDCPHGLPGAIGDGDPNLSSVSDTPASMSTSMMSCTSMELRETEKYHKFNLLGVWDKEKHSNSLGRSIANKKNFRSNTASAFASRISEFSEEIPIDEASEADSSLSKMKQADSMISHILLHPHSLKRSLWDFASLFLVLYDIIAIPLQLFDPPESAFTDFMAWMTRLFWTTDMCVSFMSGFVTTDGFIEMRFPKIVSRYLRTWFAIDSAIVTVEWVELVSKSSGIGYAKAAKASRTFRIVRMVRLVRLVRMREVFELLTERINSDKALVIADMSKLVVLIVGLAHFIACVWYGIGVNDGHRSWLLTYKFNERTFAAKYFVSLHWSLSQFAGGMDEITPENVPERIYNIIVFIFCFVLSAVFIACLTSSMTQLQFIGNEQKQEMHILRRYLAQNGISGRLALRVQRNATHTVKNQQRIMPEARVSMLSLVSEPMLVELHFEMYSRFLKHHMFFNEYIFECPQVMRKVCHLALSHQNVAMGDVIFNDGEMPQPPKMYIVCNGVLEYKSERGNVFKVSKDECISEATLWTTWMHRGVLAATADCRLCVMNATIFQSVAGQFHHGPSFDPKAYASEFVAVLNKASQQEMELTDLADTFCVARGLNQQRFAMRTMSRQTLVSIGDSLKLARSSSFGSRTSKIADEEEIPAGSRTSESEPSLPKETGIATTLQSISE